MIRGTLHYLGDNLLLLEDLFDLPAVQGLNGPLLLRASEAEKLDKILAHGTDRAGYPGDRRWRHDPSVAHEDVILATTPAENREAEAEPERSSSLKKFAIIERPLLLLYAADALEQLRPSREGPASAGERGPEDQSKEYRFRDPSDKLAALLGVFEVRKHELPAGWFRPDEGLAYRELVERATEPTHAHRRIVEVGCWLGRSTSYIAGRCRARGIALTCVDHWSGSSDEYDARYRERLAASDVEAAFRSHLRALELDTDIRRQDSLTAAASMLDHSLDLVFLDASHDEGAITADIAAWLPKLREGGVLAGHDYDDDHPGVRTAVDRAAREHGRTLGRPAGSVWVLG